MDIKLDLVYGIFCCNDRDCPEKGKQIAVSFTGILNGGIPICVKCGEELELVSNTGSLGTPDLSEPAQVAPGAKEVKKTGESSDEDKEFVVMDSCSPIGTQIRFHICEDRNSRDAELESKMLKHNAIYTVSSTSVSMNSVFLVEFPGFKFNMDHFEKL